MTVLLLPAMRVCVLGCGPLVPAAPDASVSACASSMVCRPATHELLPLLLMLHASTSTFPFCRQESFFSWWVENSTVMANSSVLRHHNALLHFNNSEVRIANSSWSLSGDEAMMMGAEGYEEGEHAVAGLVETLPGPARSRLVIMVNSRSR